MAIRTVTMQVDDIAWEPGKSPDTLGAQVVTAVIDGHDFVVTIMPMDVLHQAGTRYEGSTAVRKHDYGTATGWRAALRGTTSKGRDILVSWMLAFPVKVVPTMGNGKRWV